MNQKYVLNPMGIGLLFAGLLMLPGMLRAQICDDCRYISYMFDSVEVHTEQFGQGINADGQNQQLMMDIYEPYGDTVTNRPLMIFAFGGGFIQGSRDEGYVVRGAKRFAKAGYVVAAIDYRIGFSIPGLWPSPTEELMRVFFRAMQDMRGAVQWFRADVDQFGNNYNIDPDKIFVGGASAGAITAVMMTYCDDSTEFEELGSLSAIDQLGGFYSSSGLYPGYSWEPAGVFSIAGAIVNTDWMEAGDPPIISAHGDEDGTVPYQGGNLDFGFVSIGLEGGYNIHQKAESEGICSFLYTDEGGDHPSGNASVDYFDQIYVRGLPRIHAWVNDRSFCCPLELDLIPDEITFVIADPIQVGYNVTNDSGNVQTFHCGSVCFPGSNEVMDDYQASQSQSNYYVIGIATEGNCQATDFSPMGQTATSNQQADHLLTDFTASPIPGNDQITIQMGPSARGNTTVRLRDTKGKIVLESSGYQRSLLLKTSHIAAGAYFLELQNNGKTGVQKIILQ